MKIRLLILFVLLPFSAMAQAHSVTLTWSAPAQPAGVTVQSWNISRSNVSGGPYTAIAAVPAATLTFTDVTVKAAATYYYVAATLATSGQVSVNSPEVSATIPAAVAPSIIAEPASQSVAVGQTVTFAVVASGTAPFTYQWVKNGAPIAGATSASYTTPATVASDNQSKYAVAVTNSAGVDYSLPATLSISNAVILNLTCTVIPNTSPQSYTCTVVPQ